MFMTFCNFKFLTDWFAILGMRGEGILLKLVGMLCKIESQFKNTQSIILHSFYYFNLLDHYDHLIFV
jgi:hypothetical protein